MKNTTGIQFKNDASGKVKSVTIDLEKYGKDLHYFFKKMVLFMKKMILKKNGQKEFLVVS